MLGIIIIFLSGVFITGIICFPIMHHYKKHISELETKTASLSRETAAFRDKTAKLAAAVKESAGALSVSGNGSWIVDGSQAGKFGIIESTINENTRIAADIVDKTNSVANIASRMEENVLTGFEILEKNVRKMEDIKEKNSGVINGIVSLGNKVNKIRDIVRIINTITDQTKVIAFNAALEAASAGETGKRFAVVAGEVNRLADDIDVLTRQIREKVEEIQSSSSSLIMYSEEGSDRIAEGYKLIKDLEDIFKEIRSGAEITSNQVQIITVSTKQQLKSSEQIFADIADVTQQVKDIAGASEIAAIRAGTLAERTNILEKFLADELSAAYSGVNSGEKSGIISGGQGGYGA